MYPETILCQEETRMNLILFESPLHDTGSVLSCRQGLFEKLKDKNFREEYGLPQEGDLNIVKCTEPELPSDNTVCFIATGGTEELFRENLEKLPKDIILLSDGYHNSLAASFEIASYLDNHGLSAKMVNIPMEADDDSPGQEITVCKSENRFADIYSRPVREYLRRSTVGLIGGASPWLIASEANLDYLTSEFGTKFIRIDIAELTDEYKKISSAYSGELSAEEARIKAAEHMEKALRAIVAKYNLTALTLKCFDLLGSCRTTACLALARLNDEGIICGCEGDLPTLWTMMTLYAHFGKAPFMANPSSSDRKRLSVDFAHCTIPLSMTSSYTLPTHFESGIGVGIAGILPTGSYSIVKIGGKKMDRLFWAKGRITANTNIAARCRTQVSFRFNNEDDFDRFFANRLGNHIVLTPDI